MTRVFQAWSLKWGGSGTHVICSPHAMCAGLQTLGLPNGQFQSGLESPKTEVLF